jgi:ribonuclease HI
LIRVTFSEQNLGNLKQISITLIVYILWEFLIFYNSNIKIFINTRLNFSRDVNLSTCRWDLGIVLRTEEGKCVGAATSVVQGSTITLEGEALGLKATIEFAQAYPHVNITIKMDSKLIVEAVQNQSFSRNYWGCISRHSASILHSNPNRSICWTRRSGNNAAHILANWAFSEPNRIWVNDTPLSIQDIIQKEISTCIPISWFLIYVLFQKKKSR